MRAPPPPKSALGIYRLLCPTAGVRVSPLCLGSMSFGTAWKELINSSCTKDETFKILDHYYENGGNFIDSANVYHQGESEQWLGEWMKERNNRHEMVIATKYAGPSPLPFASAKIRVNFAGNHTKSLLSALEASLKQMQTSYVDILYIHVWDFSTSIPEVMQALNRLVNAGKIHYLGISDAPAWVALKANLYAQQHGLAQFVIYQGMYSAAVRDCEREILPVCEDSGMAFAPYGSLGGGLFRTKEQLETQKQNGENRTVAMYTQNERYERVSAVLEEIAKEKGVKMTQLALAWTLQRAPNVFPIIGCRKLEYLQDAMEALTIKLSEEESVRIDRASKFEPGFPISFTFQHFDDNFNYKPSMTLADTTLARMGSPLAIVEKPRPIAAHSKEQLAGGK